MVRIKKEQEMFLAKFRSMTPEQQQECVEKLEYDLRYVKAYQEDVRDSYSNGDPLSDKAEWGVALSSMVLGAVALGAAMGMIKNDVGLGIFMGVWGGGAGFAVGKVVAKIFPDIYKAVKNGALDRKNHKLKQKELKLSRKLNVIKDFSSVQNREDVQEDVNLASL